MNRRESGLDCLRIICMLWIICRHLSEAALPELLLRERKCSIGSTLIF